MTDLDPAVRDLTAGQYREALILILAELENLNPAEPLETTRRLHRLRVHIATIVGTVSAGMEPIYGLRGLRRAQAEGAGE